MPHSTSSDVTTSCVTYFYLDMPSNLRKNDMSTISRHEDAIAKGYITVEHGLSDDIITFRIIN
jgi:hypothetical protein